MLRILLCTSLLSLTACFGGHVQSPSDMADVRAYVQNGAEQEHWVFVPLGNPNKEWRLAKLVSTALQESFPEKAHLQQMGEEQAHWWAIDRLQLISDLLESEQPCLQIKQYDQWHSISKLQLQHYIEQPAAIPAAKPALRWLEGATSCK